MAISPEQKSEITSSEARKAGPSVTDLILKSVSASNERKGVSLAALKKALAVGGYDVENNSWVKLALKALVKKGSLVQIKGTGASGSVKVSKGGTVKKPAKKAAKAKKAPAKKVSKKVPKKARKPAAAPAKKAAKKPAVKVKVIKARKATAKKK